VVRAGRVLFALFDVAAIIQAVADSTGSLVNFFSFFTIESNLLAIVVLLVGGLRNPSDNPSDGRWAYLRGAVTFFMVVTGIVYAVLLQNAEVGLASAWVDDALHQVTPLALLADWLVFPPWPSVGRSAYRRSLGWLVFPLAYFAYSLARGPAADWYPYPFIDPRRPGGYGGVAASALILAAAMAALALVLTAAGRSREKFSRPERDRPSPPPAR
jgi:lysylphosphatidylglycerol synthetase-like protein (DUF2156 family)